MTGDTIWQRTKCDSNGCVEVNFDSDNRQIGIRSSDHPNDVIWITPDEWKQFVTAIADGQFDHIAG